MRRFDRRSFIKIGSIAPWGLLSWGDVLRAKTASKKDLSIVHILLGGGLSHIDTFDMKPDLDAKYRSIFKPIPTNVDGLQVCEHLPLTAKQADKYTVIRSMTHKDGSHEGAMDLVLTGHKPLPTMKHPSMGAVVNKELGPRNELPAYVAVPSARRSEQAGFLGPQFNLSFSETQCEESCGRTGVSQGTHWKCPHRNRGLSDVPPYLLRNGYGISIGPSARRSGRWHEADFLNGGAF